MKGIRAGPEREQDMRECEMRARQVKKRESVEEKD